MSVTVPQLYIIYNNVRACRAILQNDAANRLRKAPEFSREGAAEIAFWIFASCLKIYGIVRALTL